MFFTTKKNIAKLRSIWGRPVERHRNFDLITIYHDLFKQNWSGDFVDQKTWDDLDFNSLFSKIDRTTSRIGQQYLYHLLHVYVKDESILMSRYETIHLLKNNSELRESIQLKLLPLDNVSSYFIPNLLLNKSLPSTKFYPAFYLCSFLSLLSMILIQVNGAFIFAAIAILIMNLIINKFYTNKIHGFFSGFASLNALISSAITISGIKSEVPNDGINTLRSQRRLLKSLKKKIGYLVIDKVALNDFAVIAIEYMNMFMLFDVIAYYRSVHILSKHQKEMHQMFEIVAELDAFISVASYLADGKKYSTPQFTRQGTIGFTNLYHPLIDNAVPNSLPNMENSALITGSNMSGKTTFIKTLGINLILAQTLNICMADSLTTPHYKIKTAIRRGDDLEEGKSYFFVEIEELRNFIQLSDAPNEYLFLIDEIFRGTNTIERLAASTAVLKYLANNNHVFVTTHDIELQELLKSKFQMFHFSDLVENGSFLFTYKIQSGPCTSGNAIKLLEFLKYPAQITEEANTIVNSLIGN